MNECATCIITIIILAGFVTLDIVKECSCGNTNCYRSDYFESYTTNNASNPEKVCFDAREMKTPCHAISAMHFVFCQTCMFRWWLKLFCELNIIIIIHTYRCWMWDDVLDLVLELLYRPNAFREFAYHNSLLFKQLPPLPSLDFRPPEKLFSLPCGLELRLVSWLLGFIPCMHLRACENVFMGSQFPLQYVFSPETCVNNSFLFMQGPWQLCLGTSAKTIPLCVY